MTQQPHVVYQPVHQSNGLGTAGFVISLIGLVTGGVLSPIGLIISLIALGRQPKGLAIAGVIIGLIGSCGIIATVVFAGAAVLALLGIGVAAAIAHSDQMALVNDMSTISVAIEQYRGENGVLPADLGELSLRPSLLIDPWGNEYEYHFNLTEEGGDEFGYDLVSLGEDMTSGTEDDIRFTQMGDWFNLEGQGMQIDFRGGDDAGGMTIDLGGMRIEATGDDEGGRIYITDGTKRIEITGDDEGGNIVVGGEAHEDEEHEARGEEHEAGGGEHEAGGEGEGGEHSSEGASDEHSEGGGG